jgi:DnaJ-class molecular chaperone
MLFNYLVFDLPLDATEDEIRQAYLENVKKYPPEKDPQRFRKLTQAYEDIKNNRVRIHNQLHPFENISNSEEKLFELAKVKPLKRRRMGLLDLIKAQK